MTEFILDANDLRRKQDDPLDTAIASVAEGTLLNGKSPTKNWSASETMDFCHCVGGDHCMC
jgi:hypothetical protein